MRLGKIILLSLLCVGCATQQQAQSSAQQDAVPQPVTTVIEGRTPMGEPLAGVDAVVVKVTARVKSVDMATRKVTLVGPEGNVFTVKASDQVKRLNEIKPGDNVEAEFLQSMEFEVRPLTAEEKANPVVAVGAAGRADASAAPAAGVGQQIRTTVMISAINTTAGTVTLTMPDHKKKTIKAKYPENLKRIKVGDTAVVTYTEAIGINLVPRAKKK